jgi:hypothetical protein
MVRPVAPFPLAIRNAFLRRAWVVFLVLSPALSSLEPLAADQANLAGPAGSGAFGTSVTVLPNGNFVVTDPFYDLPTGESEVGAVYLYSPSGALLSTLTGTHDQDNAGSGGVAIVGNGNFVVCSPHWANGDLQRAGAVTWGSGVTGISGMVSGSNSLVGGGAMDQVGSVPPQGSAVTVLTNGNYVVSDPAWGGSSARGAVIWGDGATGTSGTVSSANSLVGASNNDQIGKYGVEILKNGNYAVRSPDWDNGAIIDAGAVTWGNGATGTSGVVGPAISLVGSSRADRIGAGDSFWPGVTALSNGNFVVLSPSWENGSVADAGAVTWVSGATGLAGPVTSSNSLVGSTSLDFRDWVSIRELSNGHYVVCFPSWDYGPIPDAGAAMWCNGNAGPTGPITATVALVGTVSGGLVGYGGITPLTHGNYVVCSPSYSFNGLNQAGAVTWCNGAAEATGRTGPVTGANSLIGAKKNDQVGLDGATALSNGNYVVISSFASNGNVTAAGAVTWCSGRSTRTGAISATNSLMGSQPYDEAGAGGVTALSNGNYVVASPSWNNGSATAAGAVTWGSGTSGVSGPISAANSLVGTSPDDRVGSARVLALGNGNYVVSSTGWNKGDSTTAPGAGAVTWGSGVKGVKGPVTGANSLVGSNINDQLGHAGIQVLANQDYLVGSDAWDNGSASNAGAITLGSGASGVSGAVSAANSLIGSSADSRVGSGSMVCAADSGYAFSCPAWNNGGLPHTGAVVVVLPGGTPTGIITSSLGVVGLQANGGTELSFGYDPVRHRIVVGQPDLNRVSLFSYGSSLTPREKFAWWASAAGLQGSRAAPESRPFGDDVSNLLKYAFNLNGSDADRHPLPPGSGTSGLPPFTISGNAPACVFRTEYVRRKDSGLTYQPMISEDLRSFNPMTGTEAISPIDDTWERVVMEQPIDPAANPQLFGVVQVSLP